MRPGGSRPCRASSSRRSDAAYVALNLKLLRNPGLVNALDGCAASLPCHVPGEAPVGFSVAGMRGTDAHVLGVAQAIEAVLNK